MITRDPANFREYAAVLTCSNLVHSAILLIFVIIIVPVFTGKPVALPESAGQFFFGLVMAAIGFLIGKQTTGPTGATMNIPVPEGSTVSTTSTTDVKSI